MTAEVWTTIAACGGLVVAIVAAVYAGSQARSARRALKVAEEQASLGLREEYRRDAPVVEQNTGGWGGPAYYFDQPRDGDRADWVCDVDLDVFFQSVSEDPSDPYRVTISKVRSRPRNLHLHPHDPLSMELVDNRVHFVVACSTRPREKPEFTIMVTVQEPGVRGRQWHSQLGLRLATSRYYA